MAFRCPRTGRFFRPLLQDDGTLDTVISCSECGQQERYNPEPPPSVQSGDPNGLGDDEWDRVGEAMEMFLDDHAEDLS